MKFDDCYYLEYSDYRPHLYCYTHSILVNDISFNFLQVFYVELVNPQPDGLTFMWTCESTTRWVDFSNSVNHDRVKVLSYNKYSLLFLPVVGVEPAISWWFHSKVLFNQTNTLSTAPCVLAGVKSSGGCRFKPKEGQNIVSITIKMRSIIQIF